MHHQKKASGFESTVGTHLRHKFMVTYISTNLYFLMFLFQREDSYKGSIVSGLPSGHFPLNTNVGTS